MFLFCGFLRGYLSSQNVLLKVGIGDKVDTKVSGWWCQSGSLVEGGREWNLYWESLCTIDVTWKLASSSYRWCFSLGVIRDYLVKKKKKLGRWDINSRFEVLFIISLCVLSTCSCRILPKLADILASGLQFFPSLCFQVARYSYWSPTVFW